MTFAFVFKKQRKVVCLTEKYNKLSEYGYHRQTYASVTCISLVLET